jgi:UDPglucose--hexose-1-phosphate uridylyltransferase
VNLTRTSIRLADGRELIYFDEREGIDRGDPDTRDLGVASTPARSAATPRARSG